MFNNIGMHPVSIIYCSKFVKNVVFLMLSCLIFFLAILCCEQDFRATQTQKEKGAPTYYSAT